MFIILMLEKIEKYKNALENADSSGFQKLKD